MATVDWRERCDQGLSVWLLTRAKTTNDVIGEFVRYARADRNFPRDLMNDFRPLKAYLLDRGAEDETLIAAYEAWRRYVGLPPRRAA